MEVAVGNFQKNPQKGTKILFCGLGLKWFSTPRGANSKTIHDLVTFNGSILKKVPK